MSNEANDTMAQDLWRRAKMIFMASLRSDDERVQSDRYFSMIKSVRFDGNKFLILTPTSYAANFFKDNYEKNLKQSFDLAGGNPELELSFVVDSNLNTGIINTEQPKQIQTNNNNNQPIINGRVSNFVSTMPLREGYTFSEFVKGPSNSWAYAAAMGVVEHPGASGYNPLFIHGGTGLGKTHLMQAIGHELARRHPMISVCYLTAEQFLNQYVDALTNNTMQAFRDRYRKIDVLLVDDVQFLQKGKQCQEEFFNTFNALTNENKQIVMTSDVAPKNLPALEVRLISRFEGGMVQQIESPNYETRLAILQKKAEQSNQKIPDSIIQFIAENIKSHVRAMEGALARVKVMVQMNPNEIITNEMLSYQLRDLIEKEQTIRKLTIEEIQEVISRKYGVTKQQILSSERTQSIVTPRQMAMYIARKYTTRSLQEIAKIFDKSHATILHGVKTISTRLEVEEDLRRELDEIIKEFGLQTTDKAE